MGVFLIGKSSVHHWRFYVEQDGKRLECRAHDRSDRWTDTIMLYLTDNDWHALAVLVDSRLTDDAEPLPCDATLTMHPDRAPLVCVRIKGHNGSDENRNHRTENGIVFAGDDAAVRRMANAEREL